jgi:hypothetical protein
VYAEGEAVLERLNAYVKREATSVGDWKALSTDVLRSMKEGYDWLLDRTRQGVPINATAFGWLSIARQLGLPPSCVLWQKRRLSTRRESRLHLRAYPAAILSAKRR